jgi:hypothetical protein
MALPRRYIDWPDTVRIIPSRYPSIGPFDRVSRAEDLEALYQLEARTNPRVRQDWGELDLVRPEDRLTGPGTTPIMAAFTHPNPDGSRFGRDFRSVLRRSQFKNRCC